MHVRANQYEEALCIAAFANTLERRHGATAGGAAAATGDMTTSTTTNHNKQ
jgi:hypothetical protein